jgi:hypothetical protein
MGKERKTKETKADKRKKPLDQAEEWANRDMPDDAQRITQAGPTYSNPNEDEHLEG